MTEKAEQILVSALELFVANGFDGTSTIQIAKKANVSEALIFRHFNNKAGLLEAIVKKGQELFIKPIKEILEDQNPESIISKTLELPLVYFNDKSNYWRLLIEFKSKDKTVSELMHRESKIEQLKGHVQKAFEQIKVSNPVNESHMVYILIYGISMLIYDPEHYELCKSTIEYLKKKYRTAV